MGRPDILLVSPSIPPAREGNAVTLRRIIEGIPEFRFTAVTPNEFTLPQGFHPQIVHFFNFPRCLPALPLVPQKTQWIISITGTDIYNFINIFKKNIPPKVSLVFPNQETLDYLRGTGFDTDQHPIRIIHRGVQLEAGDNETFPLPFSSPYLYWGGHLRPVKGLHEFLTVFLDSPFPYPLGVAGKILDPVYFNLLPSDPGRWRHLGELAPANHFQCLRSAYFAVNSSLFEGESNFIREAMHCSIPVLARDNPGNRALIQHLKTGLLYRDGVELAEILAHPPSPGEWRSLATAGNEFLLRERTSGGEIEGHRSLYRSLLGSI